MIEGAVGVAAGLLSMILGLLAKRVFGRGARAEEQREDELRQSVDKLVAKAEEMQVCQIETRSDVKTLVDRQDTLRHRVDGVARNHRRRIERLEAWRLKSDIPRRKK